METVDKKLMKSALDDMYDDFKVYADIAKNEISQLKEDYKAIFEEYFLVKFNKRIKYNFPDGEDALMFQDDMLFNTYCHWCDRLGLDDEGEDDED